MVFLEHAEAQIELELQGAAMAKMKGVLQPWQVFLILGFVELLDLGLGKSLYLVS